MEAVVLKRAMAGEADPPVVAMLRAGEVINSRNQRREAAVNEIIRTVLRSNLENIRSDPTMTAISAIDDNAQANPINPVLNPRDSR